MFKYILVPATGAVTDAPVFQTALALARRCGSHIAFLHVRLDMRHTLLAMAGRDLGDAGYGDMVDSVQQEVELHERAAHQAVQAFCASEQIGLVGTSGGELSASWQVDAGDAVSCLAAHSRTADVVVLGRAIEGQKVALHRLETVLLESGRPLLVAADAAHESIGRHIAIAWQDTAAAGRAVTAALPLVAQAESVTIVTVQDASDTPGESESGRRLRDALRRHNPATRLQVLPHDHREPVEAMLSLIEPAGTDLLVMGGYSHSRIREAMFGGFTRSVLHAARVPVLIMH